MTDVVTRILRAAEVVIAQQGTDVSLQEIAIAAGQRNKSAVQYHFGGRDELIGAVVRWRQRELEEERMRLLVASEGQDSRDDLHGLLSALVQPMLDLVDGGEATHSARFLERVRHHSAVADDLNLFDGSRPAVAIIFARLDRVLRSSAVPEALHRYRLESLATALVSLVADYERLKERGEVEVDPSDIVTMLAALVLAPHSTPSTSRR